MLGLEVIPVNVLRQVLGRLQFAFNERPVDDEFGLIVGDPRLPPARHLLGQRSEVPLDAIDADGQGIEDAEVFGVLGQDRREVALKRQIRTDQHAVADREGQTHTLVVGISQADREPAAFESGFQIQDAEHPHAVGGDGVFVLEDVDLPEA